MQESKWKIRLSRGSLNVSMAGDGSARVETGTLQPRWIRTLWIFWGTPWSISALLFTGFGRLRVNPSNRCLMLIPKKIIRGILFFDIVPVCTATGKFAKILLPLTNQIGPDRPSGETSNISCSVKAYRYPIGRLPQNNPC